MSCQMDCFDQRDYDQGLCGCLGDPGACCLACCCPSCAVGYYVGKSEGTDFSIPSCLCSGLGAYRLRRNIAAYHRNPLSADGSMLALACPYTVCCAISQDIHEWGVIEKRQRQAAQQAQPPQVVVMPQSPHYPPPGSPIVMGQPMMKQ